jgi:glucan phosphorylase
MLDAFLHEPTSVTSCRVADVRLNTPLHPLEASGTSGLKNRMMRR